MDVELQQRSVEYLNLEKKPELARSNVAPMPPWEKRKSLLLRRMAEREVRLCLPLQHPTFSVIYMGPMSAFSGDVYWLQPASSDGECCNARLCRCAAWASVR